MDDKYLSMGKDCNEGDKSCFEEVVQIWRDVLNIQDFGPDDNFFNIGGNSVLLMEIFMKINNSYSDIVTIPDLFACSTIRKLTNFIDNKLYSNYSKLTSRD